MAKSPTQRGQLREPVHTAPPGRAVALGRDGKPTWRRVTESDDPFFVDPSLIETGWTYEWKRYTTLNQPDPSYYAQLGQQGWTPVPAERHPGVFLPPDAVGPVTRGGMILMERPLVLTEEARREQYQRAIDRLRIANRQHGQVGVAQGDGRVELTRANTFVRQEREAVPTPGADDFE